MVIRKTIFSALVLGSFLISGCTRTMAENAPVLREFDDGLNDPSAWTRYIKDGNVNIQIAGEKTFITFRPAPEDLSSFVNHINYLVPVRFECSKTNRNGECDLSAPYRLYVRRREVYPVQVQGKVKPSPLYRK